MNREKKKSSERNEAKNDEGEIVVRQIFLKNNSLFYRENNTIIYTHINTNYLFYKIITYIMTIYLYLLFILLCNNHLSTF